MKKLVYSFLIIAAVAAVVCVEPARAQSDRHLGQRYGAERLWGPRERVAASMPRGGVGRAAGSSGRGRWGR